jgi:hypothetical protein
MLCPLNIDVCALFLEHYKKDSISKVIGEEMK